jgi:hypothetical protein
LPWRDGGLEEHVLRQKRDVVGPVAKLGHLKLAHGDGVEELRPERAFGHGASAGR